MLRQEVEYTGEKWNGITTILYNISCFDADFIGDNNNADDNYNWEETIAAGYESNRDWLMSVIEEKFEMSNSEEEYRGLIDYFFNRWLGYDGYYQEYDYTIIYDLNDDFIGIVLSVVTEE